MVLADLQKTGGVVSRERIPAEIQWRDVGEDGTFVPKAYRVFIVQPSYGDIELMAQEGGGNRRAVQVATVAACVRLGEKGDVQLTYEQAFDLHPTLLLAMYAAIDKTGFVPKKPERSPAPTRSGTSSSSRASAGGQSRKPRRG